MTEITTNSDGATRYAHVEDPRDTELTEARKKIRELEAELEKEQSNNRFRLRTINKARERIEELEEELEIVNDALKEACIGLEDMEREDAVYLAVRYKSIIRQRKAMDD